MPKSCLLRPVRNPGLQPGGVRVGVPVSPLSHSRSSLWCGPYPSGWRQPQAIGARKVRQTLFSPPDPAVSR